MTTLRKDAEQEPVAWKDKVYGNLHHRDFGDSIPLYTAPPQRPAEQSLEALKGAQEAWGRDEMMVLAAFSYCLGRQTYIVSDCVEWLIANWENFSEKTRWLIRRDIEAAFARDDEERLMRGGHHRYLGSDIDKTEWEKVRKLWEGEK